MAEKHFVGLYTGKLKEAPVSDTLIISAVEGSQLAGSGLTLISTSNAVKGKVWLGITQNSFFDEANNYLYILSPGLAATQTVKAGLYLANTTPSTVSVTSQISPPLIWEGHGWKSNATAADQTIIFRAYNFVSSSALNAVGQWTLESSSNGGAFTARMTITDSAIVANFTSQGLQIPGGGISFSGTAPTANLFRVSSPYGFQNTSTLSTANSTAFTLSHGGAANTSGANAMLGIGSIFQPTSGTGTYAGIVLSQTINQTGGANGITRGLLISDILTAAADYRAIEVTVGKSILQALGVGGANPTTTTFLKVAAGTTAISQINLTSGTAPTSPNDGDIWYDGTNIKMRIGATTKTFTLT